MAVGTHAGSTWNTTAGNKTVAATPAVNDLIVVIHGISNWASGDDSTITDNNADGNGVYTKIGASPLSTGGGTAGALWISIRNSLIGSGTSTTFTATNTGDTGGGLTVMRFSGMTKTGATAAKQNVGESSQTENPPSITFGAATLTANPIVLGVFGEDNPAGVTPPTGFTEAVDTGWTIPTSGIEVCWDDAGNTASSYSWSGGALTDHNEVGVELDSSATALIQRSVTEPSISVSDSFTKLQNQLRSESTTITETLQKLGIRVFTESAIVILESSSAGLLFTRSVNEAVSLAESLFKTQILTQSETVTISEAIQKLGIRLTSELVAISELVVGGRLITASFIEVPIDVFDIVTRTFIARRLVSDSVPISESVKKLIVLGTVETVTVSELVNKLASLQAGESALIITDSASAVVLPPGPGPGPGPGPSAEENTIPLLKIYYIINP